MLGAIISDKAIVKVRVRVIALFFNILVSYAEIFILPVCQALAEDLIKKQKTRPVIIEPVPLLYKQ